MIVQERMAAYIHSLDSGNGEFLDALERKALSDEVPIIRPDMQSFLKVLLSVHRPERILEVGTAVGFSAILMAQNTDDTCQITTIEKYEKRIPEARENFRLAGLGNRITLLEGDAMEILPTLTDSYDFIFMDAAKGQYPAFLPFLKERMHSGSILVTDNILQEGDLLESHYAIERRNRTIHKRMREYLQLLTQDEDFVCSILPVGDGLAVCTMK